MAVFDTTLTRTRECVVDDAHWADSESLGVLAFVSRRLEAEPVGIVFGARDVDGLDTLSGLPAITLRGLSAVGSRDLIDSVSDGMCGLKVAERIITETGGNPLGIRELVTGLSDKDRQSSNSRLVRSSVATTRTGRGAAVSDWWSATSSKVRPAGSGEGPSPEAPVARTLRELLVCRPGSLARNGRRTITDRSRRRTGHPALRHGVTGPGRRH